MLNAKYYHKRFVLGFLGLAKTQRVFIREATGLVRAWSIWDAFIYNVMCLAIPVGFGLYFSLAPFDFPGADVVLATLFTIFVFLPVGIAYAMMTSTLPRTGGDYVFQSRGLHPAIGFMNGFAFIVIIDALFTAIDGVLIGTIVLSPSLNVLGVAVGNQALQAAGTWFGTATGSFIFCVICIIYSWLICLLGMKTFAITQKVAFVIGLIGAAATVLIFASASNSAFISAFNTFARAYTSNPDPYHAMINAANSGGFVTNQPPSLSATFLSVTILGFSFVGMAWSVQNAGEIKDASKFKNQTIIIVGCLLFGAALLGLLGFFMVRAVGKEFLAAVGYLFLTGNSAYSIPVGPYYYLFAIILNPNPILAFFIIAWGVLWVVYPVAAGPMGGARFMLAAAFDRTLPTKLGGVSERFHTPSLAIAVYCILSIVFAALYVYVPVVGTFTLDVALGLVVLLIGTCAACIILPYKNKEIYESAAISKYKVGGVPLMSIVGAISLVLLLWLLYAYATINALGVNSLGGSAEFLFGVYIFSLALYYVAKWYRKREGMDLSLVFKAIPPE